MDFTDEILRQVKSEEPLWSNWHIKEKIGSGAFSTVYRAEARRNNRTDISAVKIEPITAEGRAFADEQQKRAFLEKKKQMAENEAEVMYRLRDCPNIVRYEDETSREIYTDGNFEGYYVMIRMEYLSNVYSLMTVNNFDYSEKNVRKLGTDIAKALSASHNIGVIHRDVKPANFFVSDNGTYKLGDFNISKQTASTRSFAGADGYIAPEVYLSKVSVNNGGYTKQVDIYSLGICLYQMMNDGLFPFERECGGDTETAQDMRMKNASPLPPPIRASEEFARIILRACEFDPRNRYRSADDLIADINRTDSPTATGKTTYADEPIYNTQTAYQNPSAYQSAYQPQPSVYQSAYQSAYQPQPSAYQPPQEEKNNRIITLLIVIIIMLITLATGIFAVYMIKSIDRDSDGDTAEISEEEPEEEESETKESEESEENDTDTPEMQSEIITEPPTEKPTEQPTTKKSARKIGNFKNAVADIYASSTHKSETYADGVHSYSPWNVIDGSLSTCWVEGDSGYGIGESIKIIFDDVYSVSEIDICNGLCTSSDLYYKNCRIHECTIILSDGTAIVSELADGWDNQKNIIKLPEDMETSSVEIVIQSVYSGNKYTDTCISEITVS